MGEFTPPAPEEETPLVDPLDALDDHADHLDEHTDQLREHVTAINKIVTHLNARPGGPWLWEQLDQEAAEQLWRQLAEWVSWLDRHYLRHLGGQKQRIITDWYKHPVAVELLTALMVSHNAAYRDGAVVPSFQLVEWHERCLFPTFDRIEQLRLFPTEVDTQEWAGPSALPTHENPQRFTQFVEDNLAHRNEPEPAQEPAMPALPRHKAKKAARPARRSAAPASGADPAETTTTRREASS